MWTSSNDLDSTMSAYIKNRISFQTGAFFLNRRLYTFNTGRLVDAWIVLCYTPYPCTTAKYKN